MKVRLPVGAGSFYPAEADALRVAIAAAFDQARRYEGASTKPPAGLIVPHAGYVYSGAVAASAYRLLERHPAVRRVVLIGPSHFVAVDGLALPSVAAFETPLGPVPLNAEAQDILAALPGCRVDDAPHRFEHSLEVQLPFLQTLVDDFAIAPLAVGRAEPEAVAAALDALGWPAEGTLLVVSTDLSHYLDHGTASEHDRRTAESIVAGDYAGIADGDACGSYPLRGALLAATRRGLAPRLLDLRTSGDTAGDRQRVVGYGAFVV